MTGSLTRMSAAIFSVALFLSAALMFMVQPMAGKMLLPLVGGAPAGWIAAVAFFQVMLLGGYLMAHLLSRLPPFWHGVAYVAVLAAGCLLPPPHFAAFDSTTPGPVDVFAALGRVMGLPFIALSMTSSTLQRLFTGTGHKDAKDPYFLYAASNLGSFAGLLLYPLAIEPFIPLSAQSGGWKSGYIALGVLAAFCVAFTRRGKGEAPVAAAPMTRALKGEVFFLAFLPSALLLAVTTHITTDIFAAPLVWTIPLGIYLLTFVAAFSQKRIVPRAKVEQLHLPAVALALFLLGASWEYIHLSWTSMLGHVLAFSVIALMCHMRLADKRPSGGNLTEFYLIISAGGALGGILNAFVFPFTLDRLVEYPVLMLLSCVLHPAMRTKIPPPLQKIFAGILAILVAAAGLAYFNAIPFITSNLACDILMLGLLGLLCLHPRVFLAGGLFLLLSMQVQSHKHQLLQTRNFFGTIKVFDSAISLDGKTVMARFMSHGTTTHGLQLLEPEYLTTPTAYYAKGGAVWNIFTIYNPKDIAIVGLGSGTLSCYNTPESHMTFIDIDPAVVETARTQFTFLEKCGHSDVVVGDGRLTLQRMNKQYDMVVIDAFSSDAIPTHLLTKEAMDVYLTHLKDNGLLLFNVTNRYFSLAPMLASYAHEAGLKHRVRLDGFPKSSYGTPSVWVVMGRQGVSLTPLDGFEWVELPYGPRPWTDDYTPLLDALSLRRKWK